MSTIGQDYDRWHSRPEYADDPREDRLNAWALDLLETRPGERLLDIACGRGGFLLRARQRGLHVTGVDISEVAIENARRRLPGADLRVGDGENLPFEDRSFERVVCLGSLEHFPDPPAGAREMARVLTDDGRALIYVPNLFFLGHVWFGLRHGIQPSEADQDFSEIFLTSQGWTRLLEDNGLTVESWHPWNYIYASPKVSPLVMRGWNLASRFLPRNAAYSFAFVCRRTAA